MGRVYDKPPVIEAVCEFRFEPSQTWDWTVPGLFYAKVQDDFPLKRERTNYQLAVGEGPAEDLASVQGQVSRWMQFVRKDESALIQLGPDLLTVNQLRPYTHWPTFKAMIERALESYRDIAKPKGFRRIGLRYINRLEIPEASIELEDYVEAVPKVPASLPQLFATWAQRVEIPFEKHNGMLALQTGSVREKEPAAAYPFMLDLDFRTLHAEQVALDGAMQWIEKAHEVVEESFEACITDKSRSLFEETRHDRRQA